ncbi:MAG: TRAP transporter substrate-binding protein [Clostridia bacterium]|nr:TRAP transporter substrate-binding protein [Clostridia bacterium]
MKKIVAMLLCAVMLLGCTSALAADRYTFTVHHIGSQNHPYQLGAEKFNELLKEYSGGKMDLDIYGNNQLASGARAVEGVQTGSIDIFIENPMTVSNVVPSFDALNMPYLFSSAEEAFAIMDSEECKVFAEDCEAHGIKLLGYWYNGWRNVSNSKRPIEKVEDLEGLTIRIAESQVFASMMKALGMNAVPLANSEVFTALQMGTVDAQENPQNNYINNKYYEVNRYFSMTRHVFSVEPVGMNLDLWNELSPEQQEILQRAFDDSTVYARQLAQETEEKQLKEFLDKGADIVVTYIDDLTPFQEKVACVYDEYRSGDLGVFIQALEAAKEAVNK